MLEPETEPPEQSLTDLSLSWHTLYQLACVHIWTCQQLARKLSKVKTNRRSLTEIPWGLEPPRPVFVQDRLRRITSDQTFSQLMSKYRARGGVGRIRDDDSLILKMLTSHLYLIFYKFVNTICVNVFFLEDYKSEETSLSYEPKILK